MAISRLIGRHSVQIDEDILYMAYRGSLSLKEMDELITMLEQAFEKRPYYAILDYSEMESVEAAARKRISEWTAGRGFSGAAIYGASLTMRAVTALVQSAIRVLGKKYIPVVFVKNLTQAQSCIAEMRQRAKLKAVI